MDINRNQWFVIGVVVFLMGFQLRAVSTFSLNEQATQFLAERAAEVSPAERSMLALTTATPSSPKKVIRPPEWSGWCLLSVGTVVILQSLAMRKPG